jgi:hypothetical protein
MEHEKGNKNGRKKLSKRKNYRSHMAKSRRSFQAERSRVEEKMVDADEMNFMGF